MNYQLELKQIVDFPRCRIYREFIQTLMKDRSIRTNGGSCLFIFSSYVLMQITVPLIGTSNTLLTKLFLENGSVLLKNYRFTSAKIPAPGHIHTGYPGRAKPSNLLTTRKNKIIQYKIKDWPKDNTALSYNYPCKKTSGFLFPIADVHKLIGLGKCSEMDALLDLWIHAVYNDPSVQGSDAGPVVYFRNQTGNPLFSYQELARRWKQSKSSVSRLLKKLEDTDMITLISYSGKHGSMVYLRNYLSVMFNISDVMIDKEEIAMKMQLPIHIPKDTLPVKNNSECVSESITDEQIIVSQEGSCVPESHIKAIVRKVAEILEIQGISCCRCPKTKYILSPLSACKDSIYLYSLRIICPWGKQPISLN